MARRTERHARDGIAGVVVLSVATHLLVAPARAEDLTWDEAQKYGAVSVRARPRTEFEPDGIRIGNYILLPEVGFRTSLTKDSSQQGNGRSQDLRYDVTTGFDLRSQLPRHMLDIKASGRAVAHQNDDEMRYIDGKIRVVGRYDISHSTYMFGDISSEIVHDENVDAENPKGAKAPPALFAVRGEAGLQHRAGRIDATVGARYVRLDYENAIANDGSVIYQNDRDFWQLEPFIALGARLSPGYRVFTEFSTRFQHNRGDEKIDRDAIDMRASAGVEFELSPLVRVVLKGGYSQLDYRQVGLLDYSTWTYDAKVDWYVSPLVTLTFGTRRDAQTTSFGDASGRILTSYSVGADYEMWRNLIIHGEAAYKIGEYLGVARTDNVWSARIGVDYLASKHWVFTAGYEHQELISSSSDFDRTIDKFTIGAKYRF